MQVEIDDLLEGLEIQVGERLVGRDGGSRLVAARAVDEAVDAAPPGEDRVAGTLQRGAVEHVGGESEALGLRSLHPAA